MLMNFNEMRGVVLCEFEVYCECFYLAMYIGAPSPSFPISTKIDLSISGENGTQKIPGGGN